MLLDDIGHDEGYEQVAMVVVAAAGVAVVVKQLVQVALLHLLDYEVFSHQHMSKPKALSRGARQLALLT